MIEAGHPCVNMTLLHLILEVHLGAQTGVRVLTATYLQPTWKISHRCTDILEACLIPCLAPGPICVRLNCRQPHAHGRIPENSITGSSKAPVILRDVSTTNSGRKIHILPHLYTSRGSWPQPIDGLGLVELDVVSCRNRPSINLLPWVLKESVANPIHTLIQLMFKLLHTT